MVNYLICEITIQHREWHKLTRIHERFCKLKNIQRTQTNQIEKKRN